MLSTFGPASRLGSGVLAGLVRLTAELHPAQGLLAHDGRDLPVELHHRSVGRFQLRSGGAAGRKEVHSNERVELTQFSVRVFSVISAKSA